MKIVLSRKGFDSSAGGCPSPILPDGRLRSLPIPDEHSTIKYSSIYSDDAYPTGNLVESLTNGKISASSLAHLDPDVDLNSRSRDADWRGAFGQCGVPQSHLEQQGVGIGDVFLFFGLYRRTEEAAGKVVFEKGSLEEHVIWGWLQIGEIIRIEEGTPPPFEWYREHPHVSHPKCGNNNVIYIASESLKIPEVDSSLPGSGVFSKYDPRLKLTAEESNNPSLWRLPSWFSPENGKTLSYHAPDRWEQCQKYRDKVLLKSISPGQEFVIDIGDDTTAKLWLLEILAVSQSVRS